MVVLGRAQVYGVSFQDYLRWQEDGPVVIVMIEHKEAIDHLEEILKIHGVDGLFIGPYDLSCSLGMPGKFEHPEFIRALTRIREAGQQFGCAVGLHIVEPDLERLEQCIREGYTFIAYSVDIRILDVGVRQGLAKMKNLQT